MPIEKDVKKASGINPIKSAYDELSKTHDIGTLESFTEDLTKKEVRRTVFDKLSDRFDIGTFESFSSDVEPFLPPTGIEKIKEKGIEFGKELGKLAEDFLFTIPTLTGEREAKSETAKFLGQHGIIGSAREGILRALPLSPEAEQEAREFLVTPLIPLREALPEEPPEFFTPDFFGEDMTKVSKGLWSVTKGVARIVEGLSSPENLALILGTGGVGAAARAGVSAAQTVGRVIPAIFSADMISQEPELVEGVVSALERGDGDEAIELATVASLNAGLAFVTAREALRHSTVEGKPVASQEAKPYFDRMRKSLENDETRAKIETSAEEYNQLLDDINQNAAKARLREVAGETKNTRRRSEKSLEEEFGIVLPKEPSRVEGEFGIAEPTRPRKAITFDEAIVKSKGKPVKELLEEVREIGKDENLRAEIKPEKSKIEIERSEPRIQVNEIGDVKAASSNNFKEALSFLEAKFPRLMNSLDKVILADESTYNKMAGDPSSNAVFISQASGKADVVFKSENVQAFVDPGVSPQKLGTTTIERSLERPIHKTPRVEDYIAFIAEEFRHNADLIKFGERGFEAMQELGKISSKAEIEARAARIEERGLRPQRYLTRLAERRGRAQARTAVRTFRERFKERTAQIKAFSKNFSDEGYSTIRHDLSKAWELYERLGRNFEEFSRDLKAELGENVSAYIDRFRSEQEIQGISPRRPQQTQREPFPDKNLSEPELEPSIRIKELENRAELLKKHDAKWYQKLGDLFSIEARFRRLGARQTGLAIKNFFGKESLWQDLALKNARDIITSIRKKGQFKPDKAALNELALLAESRARRGRLSSEIEDRYEVALNIWDSFKREALTKLQELGESFSPHRNILRELRGEISKRRSRGENTRVFDVALELAQKIKTVTPEASLWMEAMIRKDPGLAAEIYGKLRLNKENSVNFASILKTGVVKPEHIDLVDITAMLGRRVGLDVGSLEIRRAAVKEGLSRKLKKGEKLPFGSTFTHAPLAAKAFRGYAIHPTLYRWLDSMTKPRSKAVEILDNGIASVKMAAFWNPLFLPMYDIYQAAMLGALKPHLAGTAIGSAIGGLPGAAVGFLAGEALTRTLSKGFAHTLRESPLYREALDMGLSSTPFPNPFESYFRSVEHVKNTLSFKKGQLTASAIANGLELTALPKLKRRLNNGENALKVISSLPFEVVKNTYNLSWGIAWQLDRSVRMATYLHLRNKGFQAAEAAQIAARFHGDYASVPTETRKMLNRFFFTPTFKIAMAKTQTEMIRSAIKGVVKAPDDILKATFGGKTFRKLSKREAQFASSLIYTSAIIYGYHMFMQANGFDTEEFGVKYSRPTLTDEGPKSLVVAHSTPANLYVKYWNRVKSSFADVGPGTAAKSLVNKFSWEITPLFRVVNNWVNNRDDSGDPIILNTDHPVEKLGKSAKYLVLNSYQLLGIIGGDEEQAEARKKLAKETSNAFDIMTRPFVFSYTKDPDLLIGQSKINKMMREFSQDIKENRISPEDIPAHSNRLIENINEIIEDSIEKEK